MSSSKIPENMSKVKATVEVMLDENTFLSTDEKKAQFFLKRIEKKSVIYLSVFGMVDLKRSFLLSAFGTLFTYGILISTY
ncbi:hypothetical protein TNIN_278951 [Trichonephila inaurata madagascariensis]|uniref:Uncharacterized protein n=1 Tax=Trichonephila inaurata madagascariensis TaxID=2747483 RepID=A0A8X6Y1W5_9ARAC|nr:hypothetical protein TNIN_278951 [Trichonephila inaurata madagascariensis]